jgi:O-acetylserine/cysteine efflux transporter
MTSRHSSLPLPHLLIAIAVVAVWGTNFVVIRAALDDFPPLLFAALRFSLTLFPAMLFVKRPAVPWRYLAAYGLLIGVGQFGFLFIAMDGRITPGLASLIVQMQVFVTIGFFVWRAGERILSAQWAALILGLAGIALIAANTNATTTPLGIALTLLAALSWGAGNYVARAAGPVNMLAFVIWSSHFAAPPLFLLAFAFEGVPASMQAIANAKVGSWAAVAWQTVGNSMFGYAAWGWLLQRYSAATVSPMALLVPVFGMSASAAFLGEPFPLWKLAAAALVMTGLAVSILWPRISAARAARFAEPG